MPRPLIFLDIDGVLNDHRQHDDTLYCTIDKDKAAIFDYLLAATDAEFVVTSSWRYLVLGRTDSDGGCMSLEGFRNLLYSHWINASRFCGITRRDIAEGVTDRGEQIKESVASLRRPYVVIDDGGIDRVSGAWVDLGIIAAGHPVVWTQSKRGLTSAIAAKAIEILAEQASSD